MSAPGSPPAAAEAFRFSLVSVAAFVREQDAGDPAGVYRLLVHGVPRLLAAAAPEHRASLLSEAPPLTGTRWDALLAGVAEHLAMLHGIDMPAWCDEAARFADPPWVAGAAAGSRCLIGAPGAFLRHGALPDPMDLDARGGEAAPWWPL